jgi:hypothetical protein
MRRIFGPKRDEVTGGCILMGKPEGKRRLGRPRSRGMDNIKIYWIDLAQDRDKCRALVNTV